MTCFDTSLSKKVVNVSFPLPGRTLYHGSTVEVVAVDVTLGAPRKDFGRGFYTTTHLSQAERFAQIKARRERLAAGYVSVFRMPDVEGLAIESFDRPDAAWFDFVLANRGFPQWTGLDSTRACDVVTGPVANDAVGLVLNQFIAGAFGEPGSSEAKATAVRLLEAQRLRDQVFFATPEAAARLELVEAYRVPVD
jgi:hypothetical protein